MPKLNKDVDELKKRAINSLVLGIELFNRPHNQGRSEAVLIFLHHAFEMLLKSIIKKRTGIIQGKGEKYSYGFDKCLHVSQNEIKIISNDEKATLSILDAHRDTAMHYYQEISEDLLYIQAQAAVTLFDDLLKRVFEIGLADCIPERVLPISTRPPKDLKILIDSELSQIDNLLHAGSRKGIQAASRLRPILAMATASRDKAERVTEVELRRAINKRRSGEDWSVIFPEVAQLKLDTQGDGIPVYLRIKKDAAFAVRVGKEGEPVVGTLIKQEVNLLDKFTMGRNALSLHLGISQPKTSALIYHLSIKSDNECFRVIKIGSSRFDRYSKKALDVMRSAIANGVDINTVWRTYQQHKRGIKECNVTNDAF